MLLQTVSIVLNFVLRKVHYCTATVVALLKPSVPCGPAVLVQSVRVDPLQHAIFFYLDLEVLEDDLPPAQEQNRNQSIACHPVLLVGWLID